MRIDQLVPAFHRGDAIGDTAYHMKTFFRSRGFQSEIYCLTRDEGQEERFPLVAVEHGAWHCHLAGACSEACPKGLDPALAIQLLKRKLVSKAIGFGKKQEPASLIPTPTEMKEKVPFPEFTVK